jgi:hypothetical protein
MPTRSAQLTGPPAGGCCPAGIPQDTTDEELRHFFNGLMLRSGALTAPGSAILSCRINHDKSYAFIEFRCGAEGARARAPAAPGAGAPGAGAPGAGGWGWMLA